MNTLTVFNAYTAASEQIASLSIALPYARQDFARRRINRRIERRERQSAAFERAIRARLAPTHKPIVVVMVSGLHHATIMRAGDNPRTYRLTGESFWRLRAACYTHMTHGAPVLNGYFWAREVQP